MGIGGVAIGIAFKDIFQNFLASILILVTRPFRVGDQIGFTEYEGTVEDIQTRAMFIKSYDGRRAIIPNGELYTNSVLVNSAFPQRRWEYDDGIGYGDVTVNLRARWWTRSQKTDGLNAQDRVLTRVKQALTEADINTPFPTQQILFHEQTERIDGDRRRQREGWPAGSGEVREPRAARALHRPTPAWQPIRYRRAPRARQCRTRSAGRSRRRPHRTRG
ncbi:mechanosensitive ion channel family protein [Gemmatimonas sp.]|uniref:mechanosensitive ion channel family protein n=1 Tax=Gemmatimonas sp. TaxID=1962908 RepID=UPI0035642282